MNFGEGLKKIVNVPFWLWIILGIIGLILNKKDFLLWSVFGIILPIILKSIIFYIIDGFFDKN
jgi:hypothetical protein